VAQDGAYAARRWAVAGSRTTSAASSRRSCSRSRVLPPYPTFRASGRRDLWQAMAKRGGPERFAEEYGPPYRRNDRAVGDAESRTRLRAALPGSDLALTEVADRAGRPRSGRRDRSQRRPAPLGERTRTADLPPARAALDARSDGRHDRAPARRALPLAETGLIRARAAQRAVVRHLPRRGARGDGRTLWAGARTAPIFSRANEHAPNRPRTSSDGEVAGRLAGRRRRAECRLRPALIGKPPATLGGRTSEQHDPQRNELRRSALGSWT
jgi:hypothetical protein